jgi:hypothetical protein
MTKTTVYKTQRKGRDRKTMCKACARERSNTPVGKEQTTNRKRESTRMDGLSQRKVEVVMKEIYVQSKRKEE